MDSVGELVPQAHIRNTLFFIASSMYDFANTIRIHATICHQPGERFSSFFHWEDLQNQTIIFANYSTTLCSRVSIITTRQRPCLAAFVGKLDFSSREDPSVREHESRQTDNKKK